MSRHAKRVWIDRNPPLASRYISLMDDDLEGLGDPSCARCLTRLEIAGTDERPFWRCPSCGLAVSS